LHATRSGQRRPVAKRSTGRGQGKGRRGWRRRGRTTPHLRQRSRAPRKHPVPHIRPIHLVAHPPSVLAAVFHAQGGRYTPLHVAAGCSTSVAVVQALLAAYPEAATARDNVRRPSPLAAWMRGPERSSEVIICNQGQSVVIIRNQRALSGTQSHSVATRWAPQRPSAGPSEAIRGTQWLIRGDQRYSEALRGHQRHSEPLRGTQWHSAVLRGTQRALGTRSSPPLALRSVQAPCPSHPPRPRHRSSLLLCSTHRTGARPFTTPLRAAHRWRWCRRSSWRTRRPPRRGTWYAAPSPLAAWMRGPERSSEVIIGNQGQSVVIIRNQRALSATQRAIRGLSVALSGPQRALRGPQR